MIISYIIHNNLTIDNYISNHVVAYFSIPYMDIILFTSCNPMFVIILQGEV